MEVINRKVRKGKKGTTLSERKYKTALKVLL
jgi:hypothetical protein